MCAIKESQQAKPDINAINAIYAINPPQPAGI
jgi:hypothetical protein